MNNTVYYTGKPCKYGHPPKRYASNGCCVECIKIHSKNATSYYFRYPERHKAGMRKWQLENRDAKNAIEAKRRALKLKAEGSYTSADIQALLLKQNRICNGCQKKLEMYTIDHITPLSRGGSNFPSNLQLLCRSCNSKKRDRMTYE